MDADQYRADQGPCLHAAQTRTMVRVRVDDVVARWPQFAAAVAAVGVRSILSAPMSLDSEHLGALNIYSYGDDGFRFVDEVVVKTYVTAVEAAVWNSRRAERVQTELDGLHEAMKTRAVIEQAKGILMPVHGFDADTAFDMLSDQSQQRNIKVGVLAKNIVDTASSRHDDTGETAVHGSHRKTVQGTISLAVGVSIRGFSWVRAWYPVTPTRSTAALTNPEHRPVNGGGDYLTDGAIEIVRVRSVGVVVAGTFAVG